MSHFSGAQSLLTSGKGKTYTQGNALSTQVAQLAQALPTEVLVTALMARKATLSIEEVGQLAILSGSVQLDADALRRLTGSLLHQMRSRDMETDAPSDAYLKLKVSAINTLTQALRQIDAKGRFEEVERVFIAAIRSVAVAHNLEKELLREVKEELEVLFLRNPEAARAISMKVPEADGERAEKVSILPIARR